MYVPEMYRFVMYYFQIPCSMMYIDLHGRGLPEKTFEKWIDANRAFSAHFLSI